MKHEKVKPKKKILITGGTGLLGTLWSRSLREKYTIILASQREIKSKIEFPLVKLDLFNHKEIISYINNNSIDIIVNLVALANVEFCEKDVDLAYRLNKKIPKEVAIACEKTNCKMIHISTDLLFGDELRLHEEDDKPLLFNNYAKSKYDGECEVLHQYPSALVCRTNFFGYGPTHRQSMSDWIINSLKQNKILTLFNDVYFSPLIGYELAKYAHFLLDKGAYGLYNLSSDDQVTKYDFGRYVCSLFGFPSNLITPISLRDRPDLVRRPLAMGLSNTKATNKLKKNFGTVEYNVSLLKNWGY